MFVLHPMSTNMVANANEEAIFSSVAIGDPEIAYQWNFYGTNSSPATNTINGATNSTYSITNVQGTDDGNYFCVATNAFGVTTSLAARIFMHGESSARLSPIAYNSTSFWFQVYGLTNRPYRIAASTDLTNWYPVFTNYVSYWFTNFNLSNDPYRFYRAMTN